MSTSILEILWNKRFANEKKIFFYNNSSLESSWSYGQIWLLAERYASLLKDLEPNELVAISLPTGPDFVGAFLGTQMAGGVPVPIVSSDVWPLERVLETFQSLSSAADIRKVVVDDYSHKKFQQSQWRVFSPRDLPSTSHKSYALSALSLSEIFSVQFSSGSTAAPKGVVLTHTAVLTNLAQIQEHLKVTEEDIMSSWLPLYHDMGLIGALLAPIYNNVAVHFSSPRDFVRDPLKWLELAAQKKTTILVGPDFMYRALTKAKKKSGFHESLKSLRVCMSGSEPVLKSTCEDFNKEFAQNGLSPSALLPVYGMAEAVLGVTFGKLDEVFKVSSQGHISCGTQLKGLEYIIVNELGEPVTSGETGEICIRGPNVPQRFINQLGEKIAGYLKTGDLGYQLQNELYLTGRKKDVFIVRGTKVHNLDLETEIQNAFTGHIGRVGVVHVDDKIVVVAEGRSQNKTIIESIIRKRIPNIEIQIFFVSKRFLPRTSSGKLQRHKISELYQQGKLKQSALQRFVSLYNNIRFILTPKKDSQVSQNLQNQDPLWMLIQQSLEKILGHSVPLKPEQKIEDLGLDSVQIVELLTTIESQFGTLDIFQFYQLKTVQDLYNFLSSAR